MTWILVLYIYAGAFAHGDSVTLHSIPGFKTEADCKTAGEAGKILVSGSTKEYVYTCLKQP
jgi:orotidine-5'-phosphate decarboxylase